MPCRPLAVLALLAFALPPALHAQIRPDRRRQLRAPSSPCAASRCHHSSRLRDEQPTITAIAGESGELSEELDLPGIAHQGVFTDNVIRRLTIGERGDEPCYLSIADGPDDATWSACGNGPRTQKAVGNDAPDLLVAARVCTNGRRNLRGRLVKGVRLRWARKPQESRALDQHRVEQVLVQPNCSDWHPWVQCPAGTGARGLVLHHDAVGGRRGLVGIQLKCLPVEPVCYNASDPIWNTYSPPMRSCDASAESPGHREVSRS